MPTRWQTFEGKGLAESTRGRGIWPLQAYPCELEPPFDPYHRDKVTRWDKYVNKWNSSEIVLPATHATVEEMQAAAAEFVPIRIEQFEDDEVSMDKAEQLLLSLASLSHPAAFEVIGLGPQPIFGHCSDPLEVLEARRAAHTPSDWHAPATYVQFVAHRNDADRLYHQLLSHYPNSAVSLESELNPATDLLPGHDLNEGLGFGASRCLTQPYFFPLKMLRSLKPDPLGVVLAAMEHLVRYQWAMLQVLFTPTNYPWADNVQRAVEHPYPKAAGAQRYIFTDVVGKTFRDKFSSPLFAVSVRLAALDQRVYKHLTGWTRQFDALDQRLAVRDDENAGDLAWSLMGHCTFTPGMLLNVHELAGMVHPPVSDIAAERLRRVETRTRPADATPEDDGSVVLGDNVHRGKKQVARIPASLRARHCYVAGASGTGKSTLLLNMMMQDVNAGRGVGVLDPHGDLVNAVLPRIPERRVNDVVLFDPTDEEYPFALNILSSADSREQERIVSETIMSLERYFPASWGPRLERILTFACHTLLSVDGNATLADVERLLTEDDYRLEIVERTTVPRYRRFWADEFTKFPKNAVDPVLNKLSVFLMSRTVRNIVCQRRCAIDFDNALNSGKILLANLSTGMLTEKIANVLGSFLVTKVVNAAFRRATLPPEQRRPFHLYVDEFQNFVNMSVGFERVLSEARKYQLCLAGLANQYVGQLSPSVRQAIFGNIGVMVVFRLGVEDANIAAKEMGVFEATEIMNLELGEAIARAGGSKTAYNMKTYPEPSPADIDSSQAIRRRMHQLYAKPRAEVEQELEAIAKESVDESNKPADSDTKWKSSKRKQRKAQPKTELNGPTDPSEDDLVQ